MKRITRHPYIFAWLLALLLLLLSRQALAQPPASSIPTAPLPREDLPLPVEPVGAAVVMLTALTLIWRPARRAALVDSPESHQTGSPRSAYAYRQSWGFTGGCFRIGWLALSIPVTGYFIGTSIWGLVRTTQARSWTTVPGLLLDAHTEAHTGTGEDGTSTTYRPVVRYAYLFDHRRYESSRLAAGPTFSEDNEFQVRARLDALKKQRPLRVYVNQGFVAQIG